MRKSAIHITRHHSFRGRLGFVVVGLLGFASSLENTAFAQHSKHNSPSGSRPTTAREGNSSREARENAIQRIPFNQLTQDANVKLRSVVDNASYFRRMPTESIDCDQEMFTFLVRNPEVIVNIWELMAVTKVTLKRTGQYQLVGSDGAGTTSKIDLVFGNESMHVYYATGSYHGNLWARELNGKCIVVLYNRPIKLSNGEQGMSVSMDVFMKLDNIGADLVVKTLGPLVNKTADFNFTECAAFISQLSQTAENNPAGLQHLALKLDDISPATRDQFIATTLSVAKRNGHLPEAQASKQTPNPTTQTDLAPILLTQKRVPPVDTSSRRAADSEATSDERVDSPTILLIGKEEKERPQKP